MFFLVGAMIFTSCVNESNSLLDYSRLDKLISECRILCDQAVEGANLGEYVKGSKATFMNKIVETEYVRVHADRQSALENYESKLTMARTQFMNNKVQPACLLFNGNGYVDCGSSLKFYESSTLTLELWVYLNSTEGGSIFGAEGHNNVLWDGILLRLSESDPTALDFCIVNNTWSSCLTPTNTIQLRTWTHIAVTFDSRVAKIYVNGVEKGSMTIGTYMPTQDHVFKLGDLSTFSGRYLRGKLYDFRAWSTIRTPEEIRDNYQTILSGDQVGLVANWPLILQGPDEVLDVTGKHIAKLINLSWTDFDNEMTLP